MKGLGVLLLFIMTPALVAENIENFTKGMQSHEGFLNFHWDDTKGKVYIEVRSDEQLLYVNSLASGVGSNDLSLDRGQLGDIRLVAFERHGPKIFLRQPNLTYRANSNNQAEVKAVEEAFATSILWGFDIAASSEDRYLIDVTDFILRDSHDISGRLKQTKQGSYKADKSRSAFYLPRSKSFPDNTELEATLTLVGSGAGNYLSSVTPTPEYVSVRTHHSFIRLPDEGYQPRRFDPRTGSFPLSYDDYAVPLGEDMTQRLIYRHRMEPGKPIIYYLDPGTPEPVRSALLEGASWWADAFDAAGLKDMYRVEMLPEGADPMDVRYNTIQWVHRSTRGWSYGYSIADPRTGEILKGHVTLGSLRVRQDMLIAQSLLSPFKQGDELAPEIEQMALARLRQLSAHEVGHTLGLSHNFAASGVGRASVMDYPHPLVTINEAGEFDLADAYDIGMGEWDKLSIAYAYQEFDEAAEAKGLVELIGQIEASGIPFITDQDSRRNSMAHPTASLWDNGAEPATELNRLMVVRGKALENFGAATLTNQRPYSELEKYLVPLYLLHRYQAQAAAKEIGGVDYTYAIKGGSSRSTQEVVSRDKQMQAFSALLNTLDVDVLKLPEDLIKQLLPPAFGYPRDRESFKHRTLPVVDVLGMAETAASHSLKLLLDPSRAARLIQQKALDEKQLGLYQMQRKLLDASWKQKHDSSYEVALQNAVNWATLNAFKSLATSAASSPQVRAVTLGSLRELRTWLLKKHRLPRSQQLANSQAAVDIEAFLTQQAKGSDKELLSIPPGSPIGG